jgi:hypothetical protein
MSDWTMAGSVFNGAPSVKRSTLGDVAAFSKQALFRSASIPAARQFPAGAIRQIDVAVLINNIDRRLCNRIQQRGASPENISGRSSLHEKKPPANKFAGGKEVPKIFREEKNRQLPMLIIHHGRFLSVRKRTYVCAIPNGAYGQDRRQCLL